MEINDADRRRVATELRTAAGGEFRHVDMLDVIAGAIGVDVSGMYTHVAEGKVYAALADLIDVPTTVLDLTETTRTVHGEEVRGWECRECGQPCEEMYGEYEYCPHCRRKVDRCEGRDMEKKKKKAMISQPMRGKTDEEILDARNRIAAKLQEAGYEVADTVFHFTDEQMNELGVENQAMYYIAWFSWP